MKTSKKNSFEGFEWTKFLIGFKKPMIMIIGTGVGILATYPEAMGIIAMFGGAGVIVERIWAVIEFFIKEVQL